MTATVERSVEPEAIECVLEFFFSTTRTGRVVYSLVEIARETGLDPTTVEAVMTVLEADGPYPVMSFSGPYGEIRWRVTGSMHKVDGWEAGPALSQK